MYLLELFKSFYCKLVFFVSFVGAYFFVPKNLFKSWHLIFALAFIFLFSLVLTCIIRNIKEKIVLAKTYKNSVLAVAAAAVGLAALQVCGIGAPVCGASIGLGIVSAVFPGVFINFLSSYSIYIITISIIFQVFSLYFMNCFKGAKKGKLWTV